MIIFAAELGYDYYKNDSADISLQDQKLTLTSEVIALFDTKIYVGYATGYIDGNGVLEVYSVDNQNIRCVGEYSYVSLELLSGKGTASCSDGVTAIFNFKGIDNSKGYGYGKANNAGLRFTYGLNPEEAKVYLINKN